MRILITTMLLSGFIGVAQVGFIGAAQANETVSEKVQAAGNDAARTAKKTVHRAEEAICTEGDIKCLAQKAKHRTEEAADYTKDKAKELKNDVDSDDSAE
ncbi:MAG TPA: hypothetical protein VLC91_00480 [Spongiibacteraceae bacterium]|nr:hypothetical protein [Spongiibacteraceae bacterium]